MGFVQVSGVQIRTNHGCLPALTISLDRASGPPVLWARPPGWVGAAVFWRAGCCMWWLNRLSSVFLPSGIPSGHALPTALSPTPGLRHDRGMHPGRRHPRPQLAPLERPSAKHRLPDPSSDRAPRGQARDRDLEPTVPSAGPSRTSRHTLISPAACGGRAPGWPDPGHAYRLSFRLAPDERAQPSRGDVRRPGVAHDQGARGRHPELCGACGAALH